MNASLRRLLAVVVCSTLFTAVATAQDAPRVALKVDVTITRVHDGKTVSSTPYTLTVQTGDSRGSSLRVGTQVPIRNTAMAPEGKVAPQYSFRDVGTMIDCNVAQAVEGRHRVTVTIDESAVYDGAGTTASGSGIPAFKSFRATNSLLIKVGQTEEFTAATDRVTGETVKATVKLTLVQ